MPALCRSLIVIIGLTFAAPALADVLSVGTTSENASRSIKAFEPLASYLERRLLSDGITKVRISVLPSSEAMSDAMRNGKVDIYIGSPITAARVARDGGGKPILRRWKERTATYHSVIVVRNDSGIETLDDLRNRRLGFEHPTSTHGYFLAADLIYSAGLRLEEVPSRHSMPPEGSVGYVFTGADNNTLAWIYKGWIDAAATSPASFQRLSSAAPDEFRVIARSMDVPREVVVLRSEIGRRIAARIEEHLFTMSESEQGRQVLASFENTARFDRFSDDSDAAFDAIYDLLDRLGAQGAR